jgi:microcin C transport system permease protein
MRDYFIRRLLLIPPTLLGITLIVFAITRFVPGGPIEQALMEAQMVEAGGGTGGNRTGNTALSEDQIQQLKEFYGLDKPWPIAYAEWLGKVVRGDLGTSYRYNDPVLKMILERFPISIYFGFVTLILTYSICIPLGIIKAVQHNTVFDTLSSVLVFIGYAIPGYVLGAFLVVFPASRWGWFPSGGFISRGFEDLGFWGKISDLIQHTTLPLICYLVGSFTFVTLLMKNHLMDNLSADYVRTAIAKGLSFRKAVTQHALRNSLIPLATNFGHNFVLFVTGSFLIEFIFDINGFGLLGYESITQRDYPVVMGILLLSSFLLLLGNIISDVLVALTDPRIRFK